MTMAMFSIVPLDKGESVSAEIAKVIPLIENSGLQFQITPMATIVEGDFDDVMALISACHRKMRESSTRVVSTIKVDDRQGATGRLQGKIASLEKHLGRKLEQ